MIDPFQLLNKALDERVRELEGKCGRGLAETEYQRAVGAIKELGRTKETVAEIHKKVRESE